MRRRIILLAGLWLALALVLGGMATVDPISTPAASADVLPPLWYCSAYRPHGAADIVRQAYNYELNTAYLDIRCQTDHGFGSGFSDLHWYCVRVYPSGASQWFPGDANHWCPPHPGPV